MLHSAGGGFWKIGGRCTFFCNVFSSVTCLSNVVISQLYNILGNIIGEYIKSEPPVHFFILFLCHVLSLQCKGRVQQQKTKIKKWTGSLLFFGGSGHYGLWHPANKVSKMTNSSSSGPIWLKIRQRCWFPAEITHTKCQLSSFNG